MMSQENTFSNSKVIAISKGAVFGFKLPQYVYHSQRHAIAINLQCTLLMHAASLLKKQDLLAHCHNAGGVSKFRCSLEEFRCGVDLAHCCISSAGMSLCGVGIGIAL